MKKNEVKIFFSNILLTLFFLIHSFRTHPEIIDIIDVFLFFSACLLGIGLMYCLLLLVKRENWKIFTIIFSILIPFFFFSAFHEYIIELTNAAFFSRYIFLIPCLFTILVISIRKILRTEKAPSKLFNYANSTLCILTIVEIINFIVTYKPVTYDMGISGVQKATITKGETSHYNIYFLVFDEYPSSLSLKNRFSFTNGLDSSLEQKGFKVFPISISNYNFTPFSIASTLNMTYLNGFKPDSITYKDYNKIRSEIYSNAVTSFLYSKGYEIINLSIFDLKNSADGLRSDFFKSGARLIWQLTFFGHLINDVGWFLYSSKTPFKRLFINAIYQTKSSNELIVEKIINLKTDSSTNPFFLYAHFVMPHAPYFFDSLNNERPADQIINERIENIDNSSTFLSYLVYTNSVIDKVTTEILKNEKEKAIIIIAGDHGYRKNAQDLENFQNFNAIFLPDVLRKKLPFDSISNVNEFRLVLNAAFNMEIPLLKDSVFFLSDYKIRK